MKYRQTTYRSIKGLNKVIDLGDTAYGQWIVYDGEMPKYHINIFNGGSSSAIIKSVLDFGQSIEWLLSNINKNYNLNLLLKDRPLISTERDSEIIELNLPPIPEYLLKHVI